MQEPDQPHWMSAPGDNLTIHYRAPGVIRKRMHLPRFRTLERSGYQHNPTAIPALNEGPHDHPER